MADTQYVALLRAINVGGNTLIKMADLKRCFESMRLSEVATHIASGNVLFTSPETDKAKLANKIEKALTKRFGYVARVVVVTQGELESIIQQAPRGFGKHPDNYRYDVIFLRAPLTAREAIQKVSPKAGVDSAHAGDHVLYFSRLISKAAQSRLSKIIVLPEYKNMTIRTWNTTTKLLALMNERNQDRQAGVKYGKA